jgi:hypothetical protein
MIDFRMEGQQRSPPLLPLYRRHRVGKAHTHQVQKLQSATPGRHLRDNKHW